ncbi:MAG TPA: type II secretion system major pseudopilin GspG [Syntrophales bacterium]|nr:type II secretion system major pseudopilin GspG [Syntrophales bacterium]
MPDDNGRPKVEKILVLLGDNMNLYLSSRNRKKGFTLIELLIVMVIIGLIAALVGPRLFPKLGKGKQSAAKAQIELLGQALDQYRLDVGRYPTTQEGLNALNVNPGADRWQGPYLKKELPQDPWGRPYLYQYPGSHGEYDLYSLGLDGAPGGEGEDADIVSWK